MRIDKLSVTGMSNANFETFLHDISVCFIQENFATWQSRVLLPFTLVTSAGPVVCSDTAELQENFELYLQACKTMRLTEIVRLHVSFEDCKDGTYIGTYETHLMSNGTRATAPYISSALMEKRDGVLKMHSVLNARGHHDWTGRQPAEHQKPVANRNAKT
jgi:hypothetical protein